MPSLDLRLSGKPFKSKERDFSFFSVDAFLHDLSQINWDNPTNENNVEKSFSSFFNKTNKIVNKHAPLKTTKRRKAKQMLRPWITKGIQNSIRRKNHFYSSGENDKYKFYRNKISTLTRSSQKLFTFTIIFSNNLNNIKKTWEGINSLINHRNIKIVQSPPSDVQLTKL